MIDNNKIYDGDELEALVDHVIVGGFISNDNGMLFGSPEEVAALRQRQHDGETVYRILETGIDGRPVKSYTLLAVIRMVQRGWIKPLTLGQLMDLLDSTFVGEFRNVGEFARKHAGDKSVTDKTDSLFDRLKEYVDWAEFAEDHYARDYWLVSVNDHRLVPEGPVFVFKKEKI